MHRTNESISTFRSRALAFFFCSLAFASASAGAGGCVGRGSDEGTAEEALVALDDARLTCGDVLDQANECLDGLKACVESASRTDDLEACKTQLETCVPPLPEMPPPPPDGDGADCDKPPPPDGDQPPPPPDGDQPPPPDGEHRPKGRHPMGNPCNPGTPIVTPCVAELQTCLDTATDRAGCFAEAQVCLETSIEEKLTALCDVALARCAETDSSDDACRDIAEKCASQAAP